MKQPRGFWPEIVELWRGRIAEWKASGKTRTVSCADKGFSPDSLTGWSTRLRLMDGEREATGNKTPLVALAQVIRRESAQAHAPTPAGQVVLEVGALRVHLDASCDPELLRSVNEAMRG
jgi:hypothetical protein